MPPRGLEKNMITFQAHNVVSIEVKKHDYKGQTEFRVIKVSGKTDDGQRIEVEFFVKPGFLPEILLEA